MTISLTGFMGCGKSSVGRELSALLSCSYADLDSVIELKTGHTVSEIFASAGEAVFRQMELEVLKSMLTDNLLLSLGGGTVMTPECAELVHKHTLCIYLRTSTDTLVSRLESEAAGRPLLSSAMKEDGKTASSEALRNRIQELMSGRSAIYEKTAHIVIDTDGKTITQIAEEIHKRIISEEI